MMPDLIWKIICFGYLFLFPIAALPKEPESINQNPDLIEEQANHIAPSHPVKRPSVFRTEDEAAIHKRWKTLDNPESDGWTTEAFANSAAKKLKKVGQFISKIDAFSDESSTLLQGVVNKDFRCGPLLPPYLQTVYSDAIFKVRRTDDQSKKVSNNTVEFKGAKGLSMALLDLCKPFSGATEIRTKFKIFRVIPSAQQIVTRQYVEIVAHKDNGCVEQHATWEARWKTNPENPEGEITLDHLTCIDFEQVTSNVEGGSLFSDCTQSLLGKNPCFGDQFQRGYAFWLLGVPHMRYHTSERMGHPGLAIADVNGDQLDDIYVCQEQGLPNRLFLQQKDGTAIEAAHDWGCDWLQATRGALFVDLDNDGDQDLVGTFLGGTVLASNEGGKFRVRQVLPTGDDMFAIAAADVDNDGDIDVYTTAYYPDKYLDRGSSSGLPASGESFVYHDANGGGENRLLRNDISGDDWLFTDITNASGLGANNSRFSFAAGWEDYDNDGDQDLYVANDYGRDNFYRNDGGTFTDIAADVGAEDAASGMSVSWSDYDHDGRMDVYISNMWSSAGNRIAFQPEFKKNAPLSVKKRLQRFARGNTLLKNASDSDFEDVSKKAGVEMGRWAWGSLFADINNDGWEDILIANGFITKDADGGDL